MASGMLNAVLLYVIIHVGRACFSSGVCGGGGYGCTQPVAPVCSGGCSPGYACGQYGCYSRARARSSKIFEDMVNDMPKGDSGVAAVAAPPTAKRQELNAQQMTNGQFYECCIHQKLPDSCLEKCSFNTYTKNALEAMYLHLDKCPLSALADISYCAAGGQDHTECCIRNGVATTLAGRKCLTFCDQRPGNVTKLDLSYLPCYERFENIKRCFMEHISVQNKPTIIDVGLARTFES
ncbi:DB module family protein [Loa loa]|uniref:DB module family protein n=1 Tax=Loa loa TaxID=7209 RepID=A0A1I7V801_LOALO|nr:DB module family protein [Loa loa]EFO27719.1 DB module family protein [Loa loa]